MVTHSQTHTFMFNTLQTVQRGELSLSDLGHTYMVLFFVHASTVLKISMSILQPKNTTEALSRTAKPTCSDITLTPKPHKEEDDDEKDISQSEAWSSDLHSAF